MAIISPDFANDMVGVFGDTMMNRRLWGEVECISPAAAALIIRMNIKSWTLIIPKGGRAH